MLEPSTISPVSLVVPGPYLYRVYFEEDRAVRQVFDFEVGVEDGLISWPATFTEALQGDIRKAESLFDCIKHLDAIQNDRTGPFSSENAWKTYHQSSMPRDAKPFDGQRNPVGSGGKNSIELPVSGQKRGAKRITFFPELPDETDSGIESKFVPLGIELTLPGLYKVDYKYGGSPNSVNLSIFKSSVEVETVDQERFFSMDITLFSDNLFKAVLAFHRSVSDMTD